MYIIAETFSDISIHMHHVQAKVGHRKYRKWVTVIHSSDMSIIQKFLTNQIASNEIIIVMTPYCPTPQHLLHMQEGVN